MKETKLSETAYQQIKQLIKDKKFLPGDPLPENELSSTLKMSRTPIREALHKLEDEQVVIVKPRLGAFVATVDFTQLCNLYETREAIDGMIANILCKPHIEVEPFLELRDNLLEILKISDDEKREIAIHNHGARYVATLREKCENQMLERYSRTIATLIDNFSRVTHSIPLYPDKSAPERLEVLEAIIRKDTDQAEKKAREHVKNCFSRIMNSAMRTSTP